MKKLVIFVIGLVLIAYVMTASVFIGHRDSTDNGRDVVGCAQFTSVPNPCDPDSNN